MEVYIVDVIFAHPESKQAKQLKNSIVDRSNFKKCSRKLFEVIFILMLRRASRESLPYYITAECSRPNYPSL